ncbi:MAG: putative aminohydrolase SsnA [Pseudomonadota bacterium]
MASQTLLIRNGTVVTLGEDSRVLKNHGLWIEGGKIREVGNDSALASKKADEVIDARGRVILPGFINAHMHFYSTFACGWAKVKPSSNFQEVLQNLWWRLDKKLSLDDSYYSTLIPCIRAIRHGTTTLIDHHASPGAVAGSLDRVAQAVLETGLRASICYELSDRDGPKIAQEGIDENLRFIKRVKTEGHERLRGLFGLHASFTISEETLARAAKAAGDAGAGFHIHTAEDLSDEEDSVRKYGRRVVERLHRHGILGKTTVCAHAVHVNEKEMDLLKETDTIVVHNPQSNMNNAVGVADVLKLLEKGILVGLGTDAMTTNMLEELRAALWVRHLAAKNPNVGFAETAGLLAQNNRKIVNRFWKTPIGELKPGAAADVIIADYLPATELTADNFLGHLIFGISQVPIDTTIVAGKVLMKNRELVGIDEERITARAREVSADLWRRLG